LWRTLRRAKKIIVEKKLRYSFGRKLCNLRKIGGDIAGPEMGNFNPVLNFHGSIGRIDSG
jgi:hypothetical protein